MTSVTSDVNISLTLLQGTEPRNRTHQAAYLVKHVFGVLLNLNKLCSRLLLLGNSWDSRKD